MIYLTKERNRRELKFLLITCRWTLIFTGNDILYDNYNSLYFEIHHSLHLRFKNISHFFLSRLKSKASDRLFTPFIYKFQKTTTKWRTTSVVAIRNDSLVNSNYRAWIPEIEGERLGGIEKFSGNRAERTPCIDVSIIPLEIPDTRGVRAMKMDVWNSRGMWSTTQNPTGKQRPLHIIFGRRSSMCSHNYRQEFLPILTVSCLVVWEDSSGWNSSEWSPNEYLNIDRIENHLLGKYISICQLGSLHLVIWDSRFKTRK